jgi:hypothetical protein
MKQINYEEFGLVELEYQALISVNGGWARLIHEIIKAYLYDELIKAAKEAGKAWIDFIQDNPHLFPDGPPDNTGAPY